MKKILFITAILASTFYTFASTENLNKFQNSLTKFATDPIAVDYIIGTDSGDVRVEGMLFEYGGIIYFKGTVGGEPFQYAGSAGGFDNATANHCSRLQEILIKLLIVDEESQNQFYDDFVENLNSSLLR
ncbi:hypothetical protein [Aureivirga sp. CE67]|uniref:hypothetical protein n=1 Tax=Aureivirga sp. CE67 TaxID=1788983 RepID=UPI0018CAA134|nr:hypothetical protein [Aureivirga sp. CE67]